jgi:hypothetical protein
MRRAVAVGFVVGTMAMGNATTTHASGAVAYFDRHVAGVILVTVPGSPHPPLDRGFAAGLPATTVTELRR